jgi:hypothetical protein
MTLTLKGEQFRQVLHANTDMDPDSSASLCGAVADTFAELAFAAKRDMIEAKSVLSLPTDTLGVSIRLAVGYVVEFVMAVAFIVSNSPCRIDAKAILGACLRRSLKGA